MGMQFTLLCTYRSRFLPIVVLATPAKDFGVRNVSAIVPTLCTIPPALVPMILFVVTIVFAWSKYGQEVSSMPGGHIVR